MVNMVEMAKMVEMVEMVEMAAGSGTRKMLAVDPS